MTLGILAFDPGKTVGFAYFFGDTVSVGTFDFRDWKSYDALFIDHPADVVVIEPFRVFPGRGRYVSGKVLFACEAIGILRYLAHKHNCDVVEVPPEAKKAVQKPVSPSIKSDHAKDAYLLGCAYLLMRGMDYPRWIGTYYEEYNIGEERQGWLGLK